MKLPVISDDNFDKVLAAIVITFIAVVALLLAYIVFNRESLVTQRWIEINAAQGDPTQHPIRTWEDTERGVVCYVLEQAPYRTNGIDCLLIPNPRP